MHRHSRQSAPLLLCGRLAHGTPVLSGKDLVTKKDLYRAICRQYGLRLVIEGKHRWKVVDASDGTPLTAAIPPYVRGFIDGYAEAMQRVRAGHDPELLVLQEHE